MPPTTPVTTEYGVQNGDDKAVFPVINRTGEELILIPKDTFEVFMDGDSGSTIILRKRVYAPF